ncbi:MAG: hypothetical protein AAB587_02180 [Patescibacteria group bacterium]
MLNEGEIQAELAALKERNKRVEQDKAWETSWTRRVFIMALTYAIAAIWLIMIDDTNPYLKAFVPTGGYLLSTISLPILKKWWVGVRNS